ncbi:MAG: hypothetical protein ACREBK_00725 [Sphingomicrobium sp.]
MTVRLIIFAATAMSAAAIATAQPAQTTAGRESDQPTSQPTDLPANVVLASVERPPNPDEAAPVADAQPPATPVKRPRAARVTTCRCGDPG